MYRNPWKVQTLKSSNIFEKLGPKVKSDHIRKFLAHNRFLDHTSRFPAHDFPIGLFTFQTSRTNNKRVINTFTFGYPRLTLKEAQGQI